MKWFDRDPSKVQIHREVERNVRLADATDSDFWERVCPRDALDMVVLAMPSYKANLHAIVLASAYVSHLPGNKLLGDTKTRPKCDTKNFCGLRNT